MTLRNNEIVRAAFLNNRDAVLLVDNQRRVVDANSAFLDLFEYQRDEVLERPVDFLYPTKAVFEEMSRSVFSVQEPMAWEAYTVTYQTNSGRQVIAETRTMRVIGETTSALGALSVIRDLSGVHIRNRMLNRLAREVAASLAGPDVLLKQLIEIGIEFFDAEIGMVTLVDGRRQTVAHCCHHGTCDLPEQYSRAGAPLSESPCDAVVSAGHFVALQAGEDDLRLDGYERYYGYPLLIDGRLAGTIVFLANHGRPDLVEGDENALALLASNAGGLVRRLLESPLEALAQERPSRVEHELATLYRAAPGILHTMLRDGSIVDVSDRWLDVMGYRRLEIVGLSFAGILEEQSRILFNDLYMPGLLEAGRLNGVPLTVIGKGGNALAVEMSAALDPARPADLVQVGLVDVTERNRALESVNEQNERLERANASLKEFTYVVSHDLQEPLRKMQQFSRFLIEDHGQGLGEGGRFYATSIASAAERMSELITSLLGYSRETNRDLNVRAVDLGKVVAEVLDDMQVMVQECEADVRVGQLPVVHADYMQMVSLLGNLVGNALKYRAPHRSPVVRVYPVAGGALPEIVIEDNGIGFNADYAEQIFEPFRRLHGRQEYPGNGIGLSLCRAICDRHNWELAASGEQGVGARFRITMTPDCLVTCAPSRTVSEA